MTDTKSVFTGGYAAAQLAVNSVVYTLRGFSWLYFIRMWKMAQICKPSACAQLLNLQRYNSQIWNEKKLIKVQKK